MSIQGAPVILVTGASGFVGSALCKTLQQRGYPVKAASRAIITEDSGIEYHPIADLGPETDWAACLQGVSTVIHLAARVHVMHETAADPMAEFRAVNLEGSVNLARQAAAAGVKRLVYVSSIKVNGEETASGSRFSEADTPAPEDAYARSKLEAEQALQAIAEQTGLELVILRPPLIYGPGVKANFHKLLKTVDRGIPLPLSAIDNARSMLYLGNLVDALIVCATHAAAANQTYLVADAEALSIEALIQRLAHALGRKPRSFYCPFFILRLLASLTGRSATLQRLTSSLQMDCSKIANELGWKPPYTLDQGLGETVRWYRST